MRDFVIGYGSLINISSLRRTLKDKDYIEPVIVKNHMRAWEASDLLTHKPITYLNARKCEEESFNGVIFEVSKDELKLLDDREVLYERYIINGEDLELLIKNSKLHPTKMDKIWIYSAKKPYFASKEFPISLAYLNICLKGCMQIEKDFGLRGFTKDFIKTTKKWSEFWNFDDKLTSEFEELLYYIKKEEI